MKNSPIFSDQDHAAFFRATREINKHLHHIKEYDQIGDIEKYFTKAKEKMIELSEQIGEIICIFSVITNIKNIDEEESLGKEIIEKAFFNLRDAVSIEEKLKKFINALMHIYLRNKKFFEESLDQADSFTKIGENYDRNIERWLNNILTKSDTSENIPVITKKKKNNKIENEIQKVFNRLNDGRIASIFRTTNDTRREASEQIIIIFQKIIELQRTSAKYFEMLEKPISVANRKVNEYSIAILRDLKKIMSTLQQVKNLDQDTAIDNIIRLSKSIRENLLEVHIQRYKFRGVSLYYAPNKGELLKRKNAKIRKSYLKTDSYLNDVVQRIFNNWDKVIPKDDMLNNYLATIEDIKGFVHNACFDDNKEREDYFEKMKGEAHAEMEEDVQRRAVTIMGRLSNKALEELFSFFINHNKIKSWKEFEKRVRLVLPKGDRSEFDTNWQLNLYLEKLNFTQLITDLVNLPKDLKEIESKYKDYINPEIGYYLSCSKKHIKDVTSKIYSHLPTDYQPDDIENIVLKNALSKRNLKISRKFRKVFECIDEKIFRHTETNKDDYVLWSFFWQNRKKKNGKKANPEKERQEGNNKKKHIIALERFDETVKEVISRLEELKVRKYNLINEYLDSDLFTDITDRLQIYGGSFSIWNQEEGQLVRMLGRRFTPERYRPHSDYRDPWYNQHALFNKWFDLPERIYDKQNGWIDNPFRDTIELMILSEGQLNSQPAFYQNFSSDHNTLLDVEKENQFLFCEDGEISAFILLYRFINAMFNTSIDIEEVKTHLSKEKRKIQDETNPVFKKITKYQKDISFIEDIAEDHLKSLHKNKPHLSDYLIAILKEFNLNSYEREDEKERVTKRVEGKNILKEFISIVLDSNCDLELSFAAIKPPENVFNIAHDYLEGIARKEKFSKTMKHRIDRGPIRFSRELFTQGLLEAGVAEETIKEKQGDLIAESDLLLNEYQEHFTISERYINLCKFIDKELTPGNTRLKLKANYQKYSAEINPEGYFIDRELQKLIDYQLKEELKERTRYLENIRKEIIDIIKEEETTRKLEKTTIQRQLAAILSLLVESVTPFLIKGDYSKDSKDPKDIWPNVKKYITGMSRFPLPTYFFWRANRTYAHARLVIPTASTTTNREASNVGFLSIGFRNLISVNGNKPLHHITHETEDQLKELLFTIRSIYQPLIHPFMDKIYYDQIVNKSVRENAIKAAVARVMSRNMSHNIGSHVIESISRPEAITSHPYKRLATFHSYLKTRMGFIADISTGKPYLTITTSLFESVLSVFNHKKENYQQILLDKISGYPGKDHKAIKFKFQKKPSKDVDIALPNGPLGAHALYIIIENIIRNSFKHLKTPDDGLTLEVKAEVYKNNKNFIRLEIRDNLGQENLDIRENKLLDQILDQLDEPMIDSGNKNLRRKNWGLLEMKIAAAYLRQIEILEIDKYKVKTREYPFNLPLINLKYAKENKDLIYELFLMIPKEVEIYALDSLKYNFKQDLQNLDLMDKGVGIRHYSLEGLLRQTDLFNITGEYTLRVILASAKDKAQLLKILSKGSYDSDRLGFYGFNRLVILSTQNDVKDLLQYLNPQDKTFSITSLKNYIWEKRVKTLLKKNLSAGAKHPSIIDEKASEYNIYYPPLEPKHGVKIRNGIIPNKEEKNLIVFDHHNEVELDINPEATHFYESYNTPDPTTLFLDLVRIEYRDIKKVKKFRIVKCLDYPYYGSFLEVAFTNIVILDERVQDHFLKSTSKTNGKDAQAHKSIFIPGDNLLLNKENLERKPEMLNRIYNWLENCPCKRIDFLVMHYSIIEVLKGSSKEDLEGFIDILYKRMFRKKKIGKILFTSGRGTPPTVPGNTAFIAYSLLSRYLIEQPSKFMLNNILFSARPNKNNK